MSFTGALYPLTALTEEKIISEKDEDEENSDTDEKIEEKMTVQPDQSLENTIGMKITNENSKKI